jgi:2-phospho-L-lactate guanylyltransferase
MASISADICERYENVFAEGHIRRHKVEVSSTSINFLLHEVKVKKRVVGERKMTDVLIPYNPISPKSRLSEILNEEEREALSKLMLEDVLDIVRRVGEEPRVITERGELNEILRKNLKEGETLILASDVPLIREENLKDILENPSDVVIAPGRRGGTNALFLKRAFEFSFHFEGASFVKHVFEALRRDMSISIYDSFYVSSDIDYPSDLIDLWIHGNGKSAEFLRELFVLDEREMRLKRALR